jgi:hypothetical protein
MVEVSKFKHKFRRFFQKVFIVVAKYGTADSLKKHSDYERECITICKFLMLKESTVLLISPISGKRYIKSDDKNIFIIIESSVLTIVNHSYSYTIDIYGKPFLRLSKLFDQEVEKRRQEMEMEIRSNVKHSLSNIYENLIHHKIR